MAPPCEASAFQQQTEGLLVSEVQHVGQKKNQKTKVCGASAFVCTPAHRPGKALSPDKQEHGINQNAGNKSALTGLAK
jgi:hypothetical protein